MSNFNISNPLTNIYNRVGNVLKNNSYTISSDCVISLNFTTILLNNENIINLILPNNPLKNKQNVIYNFVILKKTGGSVFINAE